MPRINIELLLRTKEEILRHPCSFSLEDERFSMEKWVLVAAKINVDDMRIDHYTTAARLLGITRRQADWLFLGCDWPIDLQRRYFYDHTSISQLRRNGHIAAEAIDWFVSQHVKRSGPGAKPQVKMGGRHEEN